MTPRERALRDAIARGAVHYDPERRAYWQATDDGGCDMDGVDAVIVCMWEYDLKVSWKRVGEDDYVAVWEGEGE